MAKNYRLEIRRSMENMGTYRREYDRAIAMLARLMEQYDALDAKFVAGGMQYEVQTAQGTKKAPIVTTLEALRRDILNYLSALGLTPAGAKRIDIAAREKSGETSAFAQALLKLSGDDG